jgi:hypothetical protein
VWPIKALEQLLASCCAPAAACVPLDSQVSFSRYVGSSEASRLPCLLFLHEASPRAVIASRCLCPPAHLHRLAKCIFEPQLALEALHELAHAGSVWLHAVAAAVPRRREMCTPFQFPYLTQKQLRDHCPSKQHGKSWKNELAYRDQCIDVIQKTCAELNM